MYKKILFFLFILPLQSCIPTTSNNKHCKELAQQECLLRSSCFWEGSGCQDTKRPIDCGETLGAPWDYGGGAVGSLSNESTPFIAGNPKTNCSFESGEQMLIESEILNKATGTGASKIALFTLGAPGCGKSSALNALVAELGLSKDNFVSIDPDEARSKVKAFVKATHIPNTLCPGKMRAFADATPWCLGLGRLIRTGLLQKVLDQGKSYIFDTSCLDADFCETNMQNAKAAGFSVYLLAVWAQQQTCLDRATIRASQTGRYAQPSYISDTYNRIEAKKAFIKLAAIANKSFIFDNDSPSTKKIYESGGPACGTSPACVYFNF